LFELFRFICGEEALAAAADTQSGDDERGVGPSIFDEWGGERKEGRKTACSRGKKRKDTGS